MFFRFCAAWFAAVALLLPAPRAGAQTPPPAVTLGERVTFPSARFGGQVRTILVQLPAGYAQNKTQQYPVLVVLDGHEHFITAATLANALRADEYLPPLIVVGVLHGDRNFELSPPTQVPSNQRDIAHNGGADDFAAFLAEDLLPFLDRTYRTQPHRLLAGHSLGGLAAIHTLRTRPGLFSTVIASSPSLWWNDNAEAKALPAFFAAHPAPATRLYLSLGEREAPIMHSGLNVFQAALKKSAPPTFFWQYVSLPDETHGTAPSIALRTALVAWGKPLRPVSRGEALKLGVSGLDAHYAALSKDYGAAFPTPEKALNELGYALLEAHRNPEAIAALMENVRRFPGSHNAYDSLGDAYRASGQSELGAQNFHRAFEIAAQSGDAGAAAFYAAREKAARARARPLP